MAVSSALVIKQATASLGTRQVLKGIDMHVRCGEVVALFGHNGAGKSTLLRCIMGILPLQKGIISLGFAAWQRDPRLLVRAGLRYLPQSEGLFADLTVEENLLVFADAMQLPRQRFSESYIRLTEQFPVLGEAKTVKAGQLSGGGAQQVAFARSFLGQPKLLLLDEPSIGLAPQARKAAFSTIRAAADQLDAAIILVEHRIRETLEVANRVYSLREGSIAISGDTQELLARPELLKTVIL
jgi:ABC-type branched-subunit amino acid transport system ATPase component